LQAKIFCISVGFSFFSQLLSDTSAGVGPHFCRQHRLEKNEGMTSTPAVTDRIRLRDRFWSEVKVQDPGPARGAGGEAARRHRQPVTTNDWNGRLV